MHVFRFASPRCLALAILFTIVAGAPATLVGQNTTAAANPTSTAHPVHKFFMDGIAAFNAHDLDTFMQQWDDEIQMYTADVGWLRGNAAVRARFVKTFQQFPNVRMDIEDLRVTEIAPGVATVDFRFATYPAGQGGAFRGVGTGVYVLRDGRRWVEVLEHESLVSIDESLRRPR